MKMILKPLTWAVGMAVIFILNPLLPVQAEEVDLSCMEHRVRAKIAVSNRFREFDVIVENHCPGPAYWSMCIERMDPQTSKILETFTPSGQVQKDKKTRVNLRMMRVSEESDPVMEFEEFYLDIGYARQATLNAQCVANGCEAQKVDLRKAYRANRKARQKLETDLADRISTECPQSGWSGNDQAECEAEIREAAQAGLIGLVQEQTELETQLAAVDPENCHVYKGE